MNTTISALLQWWNLVFLVPIALAVLLLLLTASLGFGDGGGGAESAAETDSGEGDGHDAAHPLSEALSFVGVGIVPTSLLLPAFLLFFGVFGFIANRLIAVGASPESRMGWALGAALFAGGATTAAIGALVRNFFSPDAPATAGKDLVARIGRVIYTVTEIDGTIQARDAGGTLHRLAARTVAGEEPIATGRSVLIIGRNNDTGVFIVEESPFAE